VLGPSGSESGLDGGTVIDEDDRQRYIRWQDYRIEQLSFSINMFLGLAAASLGFAIKVRLEDKVPIAIVVLPVFLWAISVFSGCIATLSRLVDFRYTAKKIRDGGALNTSIAKWAGQLTWAVFWMQALTYLIGACVFVFALLGYIMGQSG
jgi:hypothetical protein